MAMVNFSTFWEPGMEEENPVSNQKKEEGKENILTMEWANKKAQEIDKFLDDLHAKVGIPRPK